MSVPLPPPVIDLQAAGLSFAPGIGLFDLTLRLPAGAILGVIGPSGCGKSTMVRLLNGLYRAETGSVRVFGKDPRQFTAADRQRIGYMPQQFVLYPNLTVRENISFVAALYGVGQRQRRTRLGELLELVDLQAAEHQLASRISGGMQRRVMLAATLMANPELIYADEPTAGIDPILRERFWSYFRTLRDQGRTLVVTTQYVGEASYCDLVALMHRGRIIALDTPTAMRRSVALHERILLVVEPQQQRRVVRLLERELPSVLGAEPSDASDDLPYQIRRGQEPGLIVITVDAAEQRLPVVLRIINQHPEIKIISADKEDSPFDEIFTALVNAAEEQYR